MDLHDLGWTSFFSDQPACPDHHTLGRIVAQERHGFVVATAAGQRPAEPSGKLRRLAEVEDDAVVVVGDWVDIATAAGSGADDVAHIVRVYGRRSTLQRKEAGEVTRRQLIAANVDVVFVVCSLNQELNIRRIERYLTGIWDSGARPVVLLNKADLCDDLPAVLAELETVALTVPVLAVSAATGAGLDEVHAQLPAATTGVLVGSSGVGKSTLTNRLLGRAVQPTQAVRAGDDKGRHTTTAKRLVALSHGGLVIDTPGMREFQLWSGDTASFDDVDSLAAQCKFNDCGHESEPGCAVRAAIDDGSLDAGRVTSWRKLGRELARLEARKDAAGRAQERARFKSQGKLYKSIQKHKRDRHRD